MSDHIPDIVLQPIGADGGAAGPPPPAGPALGVAGGQQDYWDFGHDNFMPQPIAIDHDFQELRRLEGNRHKWKIAASVVFAILVAGAIYCGYDIAFNDHNPLADLWALFEDMPVESEDGAPNHNKQKAPVAAAAPAPKPVKRKPSDALRVIAGNPYWALPNKLLGSGDTMGREWTQDEEETFRIGLEHRFRYQRYKAVRAIRTAKLAGSESLLWVAMEDRGFWVRMYAAVALAEFAVELPLPSLEKALANARSDLIANFFERLVRKPNAGQAYLMRQLVRLLDEKGRLVVLRGIARSKDDLRDLYVVAATQDPGKHINKWADETLNQRGIDGKRRAQLLAVVKGEESPSVIFDQEGDKARVEEKHNIRPAENVMSDDELEKQLDQMDDGDASNVQLFHDAPALLAPTKPAVDVPAPESFEYDK